MGNVEVIARRTYAGTKEFAIVDVNEAMSEITIKEGMDNKYLTLSWMSEFPNILDFQITLMPILDLFEKEVLSDFDSSELDAIRNDGESFSIETGKEYDGIYFEQLKELSIMLYEAMKEEGFVDEDSFYYQEEVWPWLIELAGKEYDLPNEEE